MNGMQMFLLHESVYLRVAITALLAWHFIAQAVAVDPAFFNEDTLAMTYVVKEAPVWTSDGKFDPTVLVQLIKASVEFGNDPAGRILRIEPDPGNRGVSITTTIAAHYQIYELLKQFPSIAAAGDPDYPALLREQNQHRQRFKKSSQLAESDFPAMIRGEYLEKQRSRKSGQLLEQLEVNRFKAMRKRSAVDAIPDPLQDFR